MQGVRRLQFLDDQDYPYKVNPQFKAWVPIVDNPRCILVYKPGVRPTVLFYQPNDYWHKPANLPTAAWTTAVHLIAMEDESKADRHWDKLGRVAFLGPEGCAQGVGSDVPEPPRVAGTHGLRARRQDTLRAGLPAKSK